MCLSNIGEDQFSWIGLAEAIINPPMTNEERYRLWRERWEARFPIVWALGAFAPPAARPKWKWQGMTQSQSSGF